MLVRLLISSGFVRNGISRSSLVRMRKMAAAEAKVVVDEPLTLCWIAVVIPDFIIVVDRQLDRAMTVCDVRVEFSEVGDLF